MIQRRGPLQLKDLGAWRLGLWLPKAVCRNQAQAASALKNRQLPYALPLRELSAPGLGDLSSFEPRLVCSSFLEAQTVLQGETMATVLPDFLAPDPAKARFFRVRLPALDACEFQYRLAWNPRLLRLNPHASRKRDFLFASLSAEMRERHGSARL